MSWICKNCETENPDILDVCEVCETHAPKIVDFKYDKVLSGGPITIQWKTEYCDNVSIYYKGETIDVSDKETYSIDTPEERDISFLLINSETTTRTISFKMEFIERPSICIFSDKSKLRRGCKEKTLLSWSIENARKAFLILSDNKKEIPLIGNLEVCPDVTTNYFIEAVALDEVSTFTEEFQIGVFDECTIDFIADKYYIFPSIPVVLSWKVDNAKSIELNTEDIKEEGTKVVHPNKATVYILRAEDEFGVKEKQISIEMLPIPQVKSIMVPTPKLENNLSISVQQPHISTAVKIPQISIKYANMEIPLVPSLTDLGINVELSQPLKEYSIWSIIKNNFYLIKKLTKDIVYGNKFRTTEQC